MRVAAERYAARGWPVFPVHEMVTDPAGRRRCSCPNAECRHPGKHPRTRRGVLDATTEPALIAQYWSRWPRASIGLAVGEAGLCVIDIDPRNGGDATWERLEREHGRVETLEACTGGGGRHLLYALPLRVQFPSSAPKDWIGVDVKCRGGYIIAPPSTHASGQVYAWEALSDVLDPEYRGQPAELPAWIQEALQAQAAQRATVAAELPLKIQAGGRNQQLASLAGTLRKRGCTVPEIAAMLQTLNQERCEPPLPADEVEAIARSIGRYAAGAPPVPLGGEILVMPPHLQNGSVAPPPDGAPIALAGLPPKRQLGCNDVGNANRMVEHFGDQIRYCRELKQWFVWDGQRWKADIGELSIQELGKEMARRIALEVNECRDDALRENLSKWYGRSHALDRILAAIRGARSDPKVVIEAHELDANPHIVNTRSGIIDLRTGTLRTHDRAELCTKMMPYAYDPEATAPTWMRFLADVTANDARLQEYLQVLFGYGLTGHTSEQILPILHGAGRNGKSTFLGAIHDVFGDYAITANAESFMVGQRRGGGDASPDLARLRGARLVVVIETEEGQRLHEGMIKMLTGTDVIVARQLYGATFQFPPSFLIPFATNERPIVRGTNIAIWRRLRLIPFTVDIPEDLRDRQMPEKLRAEAPGILRWLVEGAVQWYTEGLPEAGVITHATEGYRLEQDELGVWLEECCEESDAAVTTAAAIYRSYADWCKDRNQRPWSQKVLGSRLTSRGYERIKHPVSRVSCYRGLSILNPYDTRNRSMF